jgi:hypothetical protein
MPKPRDPAKNLFHKDNRFCSAVARTAIHDVLQRDPTEDELALVSRLEMSSGEHVLRYYKDLLCSPEFISKYVFVLPIFTLIRVLINQIAGRAPLSNGEIELVSTNFITAGWVTAVEAMLMQAPVQQRIFWDIQRAAEHDSSDIDQSAICPDLDTTQIKKILAPTMVASKTISARKLTRSNPAPAPPRPSNNVRRRAHA